MSALKIASAPPASVSARIVFFTTPNMKRRNPIARSPDLIRPEETICASSSWYLMIGPASSLGNRNT